MVREGEGVGGAEYYSGLGAQDSDSNTNRDEFPGPFYA